MIEIGAHNAQKSAYKGMYISGLACENGKVIAEYTVKRFEEGSDYGINCGRISKLEIKDAAGKVVVNYDRGWDILPTDSIREVYAAILKKYN